MVQLRSSVPSDVMRAQRRRLGPLGLPAEPVGVLLLRVDMAQALLEGGDFAEPAHAAGFVEPFAGVGLDL
jgi:hypothetical protein